MSYDVDQHYDIVRNKTRILTKSERSCEIAYPWYRGNWRRIAGSCSVLLDQTDCDQAVRSTWLGHSAPVRPNKRRRVLYRASPFFPLVATPRGHFFTSSRDPSVIPTAFYRPTCSPGFSISFFSPSYCRFVDTTGLQSDRSSKYTGWFATGVKFYDRIPILRKNFLKRNIQIDKDISNFLIL